MLWESILKNYNTLQQLKYCPLSIEVVVSHFSQIGEEQMESGQIKHNILNAGCNFVNIS